ncbi:MAG: hypothetical protein MZV63_65595 [Marinilabiliales bacterium]|nr:hypothetical protein [Marinilabiliales bacterium]
MSEAGRSPFDFQDLFPLLGRRLQLVGPDQERGLRRSSPPSSRPCASPRPGRPSR